MKKTPKKLFRFSYYHFTSLPLRALLTEFSRKNRRFYFLLFCLLILFPFSKILGSYPHSDFELFRGELSTFWSQEYIGADLARQNIEIIRSSSDAPIEFPPCEIIDFYITKLKNPSYFFGRNSNKDAHGKAVSHLISHQKQQAVLPFPNRCILVQPEKLYIEDELFLSLIDIQTSQYRLKHNKIIHKPNGIINMSLVMESPILDYLRQREDSTTFMISSSGNDFREIWIDRLFGKNEENREVLSALKYRAS